MSYQRVPHQLGAEQSPVKPSLPRSGGHEAKDTEDSRCIVRSTAGEETWQRRWHCW